MKKAFTLIELIIVIIIIGILAYSISFNFFNPSLRAAADQIVRDIRFTQSLALKEDKYQPFPNENNTTENNRSKYWFKQWWHFKITNYIGTHIFYYIFSDSPQNSSSQNFNNKTRSNKQFDIELAKDYSGKYLIGAYYENDKHYPKLKYVNDKLDLTKTYGIKRVEFSAYSSSKMSSNLGDRVDILFDNFGNVFLDEGDNGDAGDINPLDKEKRPLLTKTATLRICQDTDCNIYCDIKIHPSGLVYVDKCSD